MRSNGFSARSRLLNSMKDLSALRALVTPDMLSYFSEQSSLDFLTSLAARHLRITGSSPCNGNRLNV
jgi:hypothetical protein